MEPPSAALGAAGREEEEEDENQPIFFCFYGQWGGRGTAAGSKYVA